MFVLVYLAIGYLELPFATLGVFLFAMFRLSPMISNLNNSVYSIDSALPHLLRTYDLVDDLEAHADAGGGDQAPDPVEEITLDDVTFHYEGDDGVEDISLTARRGETVALAGPSGAGKSTIISLVAGLYAPDHGRILVNDTPLDRIEPAEWYDRVAVVPQDPFVFNETLAYNVAIGAPDASRAEIERVCEASQVSDFLDDLPDGLDSQLGDDGVKLSGGQKQRVAIARALLKDADVLLLDEATSELDSPTEKAILSNIEALDGEYITFVIGHWLSTIRDADRIYTVVDGELVESGTHRSLLDNDAHYADLYSSQIDQAVQD
jgi:subfamily B ATP-binding cassette protein MsbA